MRCENYYSNFWEMRMFRFWQSERTIGGPCIFLSPLGAGGLRGRRAATTAVVNNVIQKVDA